mgnify:CR=1 FL=1
MAEEQAGLGIQRGDGRHLLITQREVEYIDVLFHSFPMRGLGQRHDVPLHQPAQNHLATDLPWVSPIFAKVGLSNMPDRPSSNGAHASYE